MIASKNAKLRLYKHCFYEEISLICRTKTFMILSIIWFIILVLQNIAIISISTHIGDSITSSGWITQILIFGAMSIGVILSSRDYKNLCEEIFISIPSVYKYKTYGRLSALILIAFLLFVTAILSVFIVFAILNVPGIYYMTTTAYIILYWILPFIISGVLGMVLGQIVRTKLIYLVTGLLSLILGPIIPLVIGAFALSSHGSAFEYCMLFSIGQLDPNSAIYEAYGYVLTNDLWFVRFLLLVAGILLIFLMILKHEGKTKSGIRVCIFICSIILWFLSILGTNKVSHLQLERYRFSELNDYYQENPEPDKSILGESYLMTTEHTQQLPYTINEYFINVNDGTELHFETSISITIHNKNEVIAFSLFHDFIVKECFIDNHKILFEQEGDSLILREKNIQIGTHTILVKYSGLPPANLYKDNNKWILPASFAWIPIEHIGKTMENEQDNNKYFRYPKDKKDIPITVKYLGNNTVFCSLKNGKDNTWFGDSTGATLFCGWFEAFEGNSATFIYPSICPENPIHAEVFYDRIMTIYPIITEELLSEKKTISPNKVFITTSLLYLHADGKLFINNDHLLVCLTEDYSGRIIESMSGFDTIMAITQNPHWDYVESDFIYLFVDGYINSLHNRGKYEYNDYVPLNRLISSASETGNQEMVILSSKLQYLIESVSEKNQIIFFRNFLSLLNSGNINNDMLLNLINSFLENVSD